MGKDWTKRLTNVPSSSVNASKEKALGLLTKIENECVALTDWEENFYADMEERMRRGDYFPTKRQLEILDDIYDKRSGNGSRR
jgi:hypothetical protein